MMTRAMQIAFAIAAVTSVGTVVAQQDAAEGPAAAPDSGHVETPDTADLVFERETFAYPAFPRRNPFTPLVGTGSGPRFEAMSLSAIIYVAENSSGSMAILNAPGGSNGGTRSARLHVGESWGNARVVQIRPAEVVLAVEEFGLIEQRTLQLPTRSQGGS